MPLNQLTKNGVKYFELYINCPVCLQQGKSTPQTYWVHNVCGQRVYIGSNAFYHCPHCDKEKHVMSWRYKCPYHSTDANNQYLGVDRPATIAKVIAVAGMYSEEAGLDWLNEFIVNLRKTV